MQEIAIKYNSDQRKYRYEVADKPEKQCDTAFMDKTLVIKVIMDCRTASAHKFRIRIQTIWCHFNKRTISANKNNEFVWKRKYANTYFHECKFAIEINENGHCNIKIKRWKASK